MKKIQMTYELTCKFVSDLGIPVASGQKKLNILCLEGAKPMPELDGLIGIGNNVPDRYNDTVVLFWKEVKDGYIKTLKATTEPGRYYTKIKPHRHGAAHLVWGHHLYKEGRHRGKPALVSATGTDRVWRDRDGDFRQDLEERVYEGRFGIHVHAGGLAENIGRWSAGCIAIHGGYDGDAYRLFLKKVQEHSVRFINLTLWGARDFASWIDSSCGYSAKDSCDYSDITYRRCFTGRWRPTLRFGIRNTWVAVMQKLLNRQLDSSLIVDGDWGPATQRKFLTFQNRSLHKVDGICGSHSWTALEDKEWRDDDSR